MTLEELFASTHGGCDQPGCTHQHERTLHVHGRCHPRAKVEVVVDAEEREVRIACAICKKPILTIDEGERGSA